VSRNTISASFVFFLILGKIRNAAASIDGRIQNRILSPSYPSRSSGSEDIARDFAGIFRSSTGIISVASNVIPAELTKMVNFALEGDFKSASAMHKKYYRFFTDLFIESNPIPVKAAMVLRGEIASEYRLPLCEMSDSHLEVLTATLKKCGAL
jgi:4-hydroxy-tetrahydrodipicolinate synthase